MTELVSVVVTTCNRKGMLKRALDSVINQSYQNLEIIVIDDGEALSAKDTCENYNDSRIRYYNNEINLGACASRNRGISLANGAYITGLDDDDSFTVNRIESLSSQYDSRYSFVTSNTLEIKIKGDKKLFSRRREIGQKDMLWGNCVGTQIFTETFKLKEIGGFDESLSSAQDADVWLRMLEKWGSALRTEECMYHLYTDHEAPRISTSSRKVKGLKDFFSKHQNKMSFSQRNFALLKISKYEGNLSKLRFLLSLVLMPSLLYLLKKSIKAI